MTEEQYSYLISILGNMANNVELIKNSILFIIGALSALIVCLILYNFIKKCI